MRPAGCHALISLAVSRDRSASAAVATISTASCSAVPGVEFAAGLCPAQRQRRQLTAPGWKIAPFIEHARKAGRGQRRRTERTVSSREHSGSIKAWAKDQGIAVSERGRIPASVVEQYETATAGT